MNGGKKRRGLDILPAKGGPQKIRAPPAIMQNPRQSALSDSFTDLNSSITYVDTTSPSPRLNIMTTAASGV